MGGFLKRLFGKKQPPPSKEAPAETRGGASARIPAASMPAPAPASAPSGETSRNQDIPNRLVVGLEMRAVPERQPGSPRAWNVRIQKLDMEGIWLCRLPTEAEPLPVSPRETLSLVVFDERKQLMYDCPVVRIVPGKNGAPETVVVAPPVKAVQEESKLSQQGGRKHYRINFRLPAEVRAVRGSELGPAMSCHTRDISMGGMAVEATKPFESAPMVEVRVLSWNFPLNARARVVRSFELNPGLHVIALEFPENLSSISRDLISQFILENQKGR